MMNAQKKIRSFENRCRGLKKKLGELSTLCDVEVCMVCTHPSSSHLHLWPEDPSKVEQTITKYRMMMMESCGNNKKNKVLPHSVRDIKGSGRKKGAPVLDEQHLNFPGKDGRRKEVPPVLNEQDLNFVGKADDGKTKEEIFLESLPYEKLKEFMSTLKGKIEQVKQEIAVKKMQAELMELISDTSMQGENDQAASSSSYGHQKMMVGLVAGMTWMQNHLIAAPSMQKMEMAYVMPQTNNPSMQKMEKAYVMPHTNNPSTQKMEMAYVMPQTNNPSMQKMEKAYVMPQTNNPSTQKMEMAYVMPQTNNPSMQKMETAYVMPQPHLTALPPMHNIMWVPQNQPAPAETMLMSQTQNQNQHHLIYANYSGNYFNRCTWN